MDQDMKKRVVQVVIDGMDLGMEKYKKNPSLVQKCCMVLCKFDLPQDVLFAYGRVANLLAKALEMHPSDVYIQQKCVSFLDAMVNNNRQPDEKDEEHNKLLIEMGESGAIEAMLQQMGLKLILANATPFCDDTMEKSWSFLRGVTNNNGGGTIMAANCERFLAGLPLFRQCYTHFGGGDNDNRKMMLRNMMGVMLNIAQVCHLRQHLLLTSEHLEIFCKLLETHNKKDGEGDKIEEEVSYLSAGVLAHLLVSSDEDKNNEFWTTITTTIEGKTAYLLSTRDRVNALLVQAIEKWDFQQQNIHSFIKNTSLKPILRLLTHHQYSYTIGAQLWAVWTLASLTTIDEADGDDEKKQKCRDYCRLLVAEEEDGGSSIVERLQQLSTNDPCSSTTTADASADTTIQKLARIVIKNVENWKHNNNYSRGNVEIEMAIDPAAAADA